MKKNASTSKEIDRQREEMHRQMLSAVSHDLKTPLAAIIGSLEVYTRMEEKLSPEKKKALISTGLLEAYRLDSFITNILDMAKLEGGMVQPKYDKCDITLMLEDCILRLGPRREAMRLELKSPAEKIMVQTDGMLLCKAVGLLLENAFKHAGKNPHVEITYGYADQDQAFIRVKDSGAGIPAGKEEFIFKKYTRFAMADQQNAGTGLGLPICRQIMTMLSGKVVLESKQDGGAIFTLYFPVYNPASNT